MNDTKTSTAAGSVAGALLAAAFVLLLLVALIDPAGTAASDVTIAAGPSHSPQIGCPDNALAPDARVGVNPVSCTR
jgi:hypothetical protein